MLNISANFSLELSQEGSLIVNNLIIFNCNVDIAKSLEMELF
jgi:hypothetical protein